MLPGTRHHRDDHVAHSSSHIVHHRLQVFEQVKNTAVTPSCFRREPWLLGDSLTWVGPLVLTAIARHRREPPAPLPPISRCGPWATRTLPQHFCQAAEDAAALSYQVERVSNESLEPNAESLVVLLRTPSENASGHSLRGLTQPRPFSRRGKVFTQCPLRFLRASNALLARGCSSTIVAPETARRC